MQGIHILESGAENKSERDLAFAILTGMVVG